MERAAQVQATKSNAAKTLMLSVPQMIAVTTPVKDTLKRALGAMNSSVTHQTSIYGRVSTIM